MQGWKRGGQTWQPLMRMQNIKLTLAFEGTDYHGWQIQASSPTIQGIISNAILKITGGRATLIGSGRTDAGTHARAMVANFLTNSSIPPPQLVRALNSVLPLDIRVISAHLAPPGFHARRDAISKTYRYQIYLGPVLAPHLAREYFHYPYRINIAKMERAARLFVGEHDFASFAKGKPGSCTVRRVIRCGLKKRGYRLFFTVEGNGFLHHMVRTMAGTLLEIGKGSTDLERFRQLFAQRDRTLAGFTAPARGLVLVKVRY